MGSLPTDQSTVKSLSSLLPSLSPTATVNVKGSPPYQVSSARWSDLGTPKPGAVINVATEEDVATAVKWATTTDTPFVAMAGGHAWARWFRIGDDGVVINMRALNGVTVADDRTTVTIGGGAIVGEVMRACGAAGVHVMTGTCNGVGAVPVLINGGLGPLMGQHGCGADTILSARIVLASGDAVTVSPDSHPDLYWALCGAGSNFGIVTALTVGAHPFLNDGVHYSAMLVFPPAQLAAVMDAATGMEVGPDVAMHVLFMRAPPDFSPCVAVAVWHPGNEEAAREKYRVLFDLKPVAVLGGMVPYANLNDGLDHVCFKGGNKICFSASSSTINAASLQPVFDAWVDFSAHQGSGLSLVSFELYSTAKARSVAPDTNAVGPAIRQEKYHSFFGAVYSDPAQDDEARRIGDMFRSALQSDGFRNVYPNMACGDETTKQLYGEGERLERLRELKTRYDPKGLFSQFVPIS